jgi:hypothetical protein
MNSTEYYRTHPEARNQHRKKSAEINKRPSQKAKRRELGRKNYAHDKKNGSGSRNGKDFDHAVGRYVKSSTNRGRKKGTSGDKNARGKKHKK